MFEKSVFFKTLAFDWIHKVILPGQATSIKNEQEIIEPLYEWIVIIF